MIKTKPLLIIAHPHFTIPGGAGKVILELSVRLTKRYKVIVIAQQIWDEYYTKYPSIEFINLRGPLTSSFHFWFQFYYWRNIYAKTIEYHSSSNNISIIANGFPSNWLLLGLNKKFPNIPIYWYCHEPSAFIHDKVWRKTISNPLKRLIAVIFQPVFAYYDKQLVNRAKTIFVNSRYTKRNVLTTYGRKSVVIYPGISMKPLKNIPDQIKQNFIITAALLTKYKKIDIMIQALHLLHNKQVRLVIVGDGEYKSKLIQLANTLNISHRIIFYPSMSTHKLSTLVSKARLFISCSYNETFGLVLLEALAAGTPVISQKSGGPKEIILHDKNGLLINCTPKTLAQNIDYYMSNSDALRRLTKFARKSIENKFSWDKSIQKMSRYLH